MPPTAALRPRAHARLTSLPESPSDRAGPDMRQNHVLYPSHFVQYLHIHMNHIHTNSSYGCDGLLGLKCVAEGEAGGMKSCQSPLTSQGQGYHDKVLTPSLQQPAPHRNKNMTGGDGRLRWR